VRIRSLISIASASFLLSACGPGRHPVTPDTHIPSDTPRTTIVSPSEPPPQPTRVNLPDLSAAFQYILQREAQQGHEIRAIGIGEVHKQISSTLVSTLQLIARNVLPDLADAGFQDLVWEHFPSGDLAAQEAESFYQSGHFGPFLSEFFRYYFDYCGIVEVLQQAHASGLEVHGCHASSVEEYRTNLMDLGYIVNERQLETSVPLLRQGRRIVIISGARHNDFQSSDNIDYIPFGITLHRWFREGFVSIDVLLPEAIETIPRPQDLGLGDWQALVPASGVEVIYREPGSYAVMLARSQEPVTETIPQAVPVCD